ncbi:M23 family metallopeptidase [Vibrio sp. S17_S38]|uniref:M23 family metallopeptidase n=1 Tax=Vibrio sp. S17_S38 TaxID=2720229 RepID=UPI0016816E47|nr:M23 family metallopeptidase [Vibrio sp. S17_S38]
MLFFSFKLPISLAKNSDIITVPTFATAGFILLSFTCILFSAYHLAHQTPKRTNSAPTMITMNNFNHKSEENNKNKTVNEHISAPKLKTEMNTLPSTFLVSNINKDTSNLSPAVKATLFRMIPNDLPMAYQRISSPYGVRIHPITGQSKRHLGMDLTCPNGGTVYATADGVVELTRPSNQGYGNLIKIRHGFGFMSMYAHLQRFLVKTGQFIEKGDPIALCGNTGSSTGPHLHYEIRFLAQTLDPKDFLNWHPDNFNQLFKQQNHIHWSSLVNNINGLIQLQGLLERTTKPSSIKESGEVHRDNYHDELQSFGLDEDGWENVKTSAVASK